MGRVVKRAAGIGITWFLGWFLLGALYEIAEPDPRIIDVWPMTLGLPALISGVVFSLVFGIGLHGRGLDALSLPKITLLGLGSGLLAAYSGRS